MTVTFTTMSGKTLTGEVIGQGFASIDAPETYEVRVTGIDHATFRVPAK